MNRWDQETTAPIDCDELRGLLELMMPEHLFDNVDWDEQLNAAVAAMIVPNRPRAVPPPIPQSKPKPRSVLPPEVAAHLSHEEMAMLPPEVRFRIPDAAVVEVLPPTVVLAPPHASEPAIVSAPRSVARVVFRTLAVTFCVALAAGYCLA